MFSKSIVTTNSKLFQFSDVTLNSQEMQCIEGGGKIKDAWNKVKEKAKEIVSEIKEAYENAPQEAKDAAVAIADGNMALQGM